MNPNTQLDYKTRFKMKKNNLSFNQNKEKSTKKIKYQT